MLVVGRVVHGGGHVVAVHYCGFGTAALNRSPKKTLHRALLSPTARGLQAKVDLQFSETELPKAMPILLLRGPVAGTGHGLGVFVEKFPQVLVLDRHLWKA